MDIDLTVEQLPYRSGGGCCHLTATVSVDSRMPRAQQRAAVVHEALEACLGMVLPHDKIVDIEDVVCDALQQWEPIEEEGG